MKNHTKGNNNKNEIELLLRKALRIKQKPSQELNDSIIRQYEKNIELQRGMGTGGEHPRTYHHLSAVHQGGILPETAESKRKQKNEEYLLLWVLWQGIVQCPLRNHLLQTAVIQDWFRLQ